ncbi:MAG: hypothetical protein Q9227_001980 [Pyrenula ochraceoflavens]
MPRPRRDSAAAADTRPAFARPPQPRGGPPPNSSPPKTPRQQVRTKAKQSPATSPQKRSGGDGRRKSGSPNKGSPTKTKAQYASSTSVGSGSHALSADSLAKLNAMNHGVRLSEKEIHRKEGAPRNNPIRANEKRHRKSHNRYDSAEILEKGHYGEHRHHRKARSVFSARKRPRGGGDPDDEDRNRKKRRILWAILIIVLLLIIFIPVGVVVSNKHKGNGGTTSDTDTNSNSDLDGIDPNSIPAYAKGGPLDPFTWADTKDFNLTFTNDTVGGLSVMGLYSSWDDGATPNDNTPPLSKQFPYGKTPIRGTNIGGWLSVEPFITPSLFESYSAHDNIVDEYSLTQRLGPAVAKTTLEKHYSTFVTEQTFQDIAGAGLDHVRIPFSYWAVTTYEGDPYVPKVSWRYLLRGIEYARKYGLRVNLDLHAVPGSQNGWNHSGRQGSIGWLNGTDGSLNAQRSLDIHNQLSKFFAQDRYKNVVTIYGLVNEPKMMAIPVDSVLDWNTQAVKIVRGNGLQQYISFGDGFLGLDKWENMFKDHDAKMVMDTHQYAIFNTGQLAFTHPSKISLACSGWGGLISKSNNPSTGWGPLFCGEFSQADTDCTEYLNNVNVGSRWTGTMNTQDPSTQVLSPTCPSTNPPCSCDSANADPSNYSPAYKQFLKMFAEAQMNSFEKGWGWFYWTWETESATQWSWKLGMKAGILPQIAYQPDFKCDTDVPDFKNLPEYY